MIFRFCRHLRYYLTRYLAILVIITASAIPYLYPHLCRYINKDSAIFEMGYYYYTFINLDMSPHLRFYIKDSDISWLSNHNKLIYSNFCPYLCHYIKNILLFLGWVIIIHWFIRTFVLISVVLSIKIRLFLGWIIIVQWNFGLVSSSLLLY